MLSSEAREAEEAGEEEAVQDSIGPEVRASIACPPRSAYVDPPGVMLEPDRVARGHHGPVLAIGSKARGGLQARCDATVVSFFSGRSTCSTRN